MFNGGGYFGRGYFAPNYFDSGTAVVTPPVEQPPAAVVLGRPRYHPEIPSLIAVEISPHRWQASCIRKSQDAPDENTGSAIEGFIP